MADATKIGVADATKMGVANARVAYLLPPSGGAQRANWSNKQIYQVILSPLDNQKMLAF